MESRGALSDESVIYCEGQPDPDAMDLAVERAVGEAIWRHKRLGESIVIWRDGETVTLTAEEIPEEWCIEPAYPRQTPVI